MIGINRSIGGELFKLFLGSSPKWYKKSILFMLFSNLLLYVLEVFVFGGSEAIFTAWLMLVEVLFILTTVLYSYPLPSLTLIMAEALLLGMTDLSIIGHEVQSNMNTILLAIFGIAPLFFHKELLSFCFSYIISKFKSKAILSLFMLLVTIILSAFLNAITMIAIMIATCTGLYKMYENYLIRSDHGLSPSDVSSHKNDAKSCIRDIIMHSAIGTALGGSLTIVGEPQNLMIGNSTNWQFSQFFNKMFPVLLPTLIVACVMCIIMEKMKLFSYGTKFPEGVINAIKSEQKSQIAAMDHTDRLTLMIQGFSIFALIVGLVTNSSAAGLIGLGSIGIITAMLGKNKEGNIGAAFEEPMPFVALLIMFFAIATIITKMSLFEPIIQWALSLHGNLRDVVFYMTCAVLSTISDNVFVATVYLSELTKILNNNIIDLELFEKFLIFVNVSSNVSSVATPNGQAAFLLLLTSNLSPMIDLSYRRMVIMAAPYAILLTIVSIVSLLKLT